MLTFQIQPQKEVQHKQRANHNAPHLPLFSTDCFTFRGVVYFSYFSLPPLRLAGQDFPYLLNIGLLIGAIFWRYQAQLDNLVLYTLVWLGELFAFGLVMLFAPSHLILATTNIMLGFVALVIVNGLNQPHSPGEKLNLSSTLRKKSPNRSGFC